jgi:4-hydroxybenzoate polyprenyltransferase
MAEGAAARSSTVTRSPASAWLRALRPEQWVKNLLVFAALVFGLKLLDVTAVLYSALAFVAFTAASCAVYLLNDIVDLERDRSHPEKARRPLAAGEISVVAAGVVGILLAAGALAAGAWLTPALAVVLGIYIALNLAYSLALKHLVIVDVLVIAIGFVLRAFAGGAAISPWLVVCTFMVMLFLALGKRRAEIAALDAASEHRPVHAGYRVDLLDQMMTIVVAATLVSYCLYTLSPEVQERFGVSHLEATVPLVVYGLFRYLQIIRSTDQAQNPTSVLISDRPILVTIVLWGGLVLALLYAGRT